MKNLNKQPLALIILDGWGQRDEKKNNGIALAKTPFFDSLIQEYPHTLIDGSGPSVGLPVGVMGNSEVGHMNIGAGRIVYTGLTQMYNAIENGSFFNNPAFMKAVKQVKSNNSTLHLMGLLSDGAVHSHQDHLYALLQLAKQNDVNNVAIHCFMDGRDTPPNDGVVYLQKLLDKIAEIGVGFIASVEGRFWAMDRDNRWDRNEKAFFAICGQATTTTNDPINYLKSSYEKGIGDEFIEPISVIQKTGDPTLIEAKDAIIFYNFRADRAKQITRAFCDTEFSCFDRKKKPLPQVFVCAAPYDKDIKAPVAFLPSYPKNTLGDIISAHNLKQLRIAETEKYAHVTFFFNGGQDIVFKGEDRCLIPSPKEVRTYDKKPEMSAYKVTEEMLARLALNKYDLIVLNFANADMVGHTAKPEAIIKAVETVDACLGEIVPRITQKGGVALVFADHGNAEEMVAPNGEPMTAHTTNLVPFVLVSNNTKNVQLKKGGRLCDVAPTVLDLLSLSQPKEMTGQTLIIKNA
ncbi:2,3-bisphosphoglycerate-independent phosphoglycerate mutase [bacterium]|nr:2,3-bisphosphoglycerate-independent phosphoglycerate mutase [bacterium]MBU1917920.1 2,3-bisphosphoglycerate-independent phosphoglycerate mutase [bacterium]